MPRHELFPARGYRFSFARHADFATVLTDYGCPYPCTFCVIGTLGFGMRPLEDVLEEVDHVRGLGRREIFFMDQTFGVVKQRGLALCAALEERGDLSWTAFTRPDTADDEMLGAMQRAGCHTLIMGVESADDEVLADVVPTGLRPHFAEKLRLSGVELDASLFEMRPLDAAS